MYTAIVAGLLGLVLFSVTYAVAAYQTTASSGDLVARLFMVGMLAFLAVFAASVRWRTAAYGDSFRPPMRGLGRWATDGFRRRIPYARVLTVDVRRIYRTPFDATVFLDSGEDFRLILAGCDTPVEAHISTRILNEVVARGAALRLHDWPEEEPDAASIRLHAKGGLLAMAVFGGFLGFGVLSLTLGLLVLMVTAPTSAIDVAWVAVRVGVGVAILAACLWLWGQRRVGGPCEMRGDQLYLPFLHWWSPNKCLVSWANIVLLHTGAHAVDATVLADVESALPYPLRKAHRRWLSCPQAFEIVFVTKAGVCKVPRALIPNSAALLEQFDKRTAGAGGAAGN